MLTSVGVRNFKPFSDSLAKIDFVRVTILIGENGTGKSSLLQSLALLQQSCGQTSLKQGSFKFTSFGDLVHKGETRRAITIIFAGTAGGSGEESAERVNFQYQAEFADPGVLAAHTWEWWS